MLSHLRLFICHFLAAFQQDTMALEYIPEKFLTGEICLAAVQQNRWALQFVPEKFLTGEICLAAVQHYGVWLLFNIMVGLYNWFQNS